DATETLARLSAIPLPNILLDGSETSRNAQDETRLPETTRDTLRLIEPTLKEQSRPEGNVRRPMTPQACRQSQQLLRLIQDAGRTECCCQMRRTDHVPTLSALDGAGPLT